MAGLLLSAGGSGRLSLDRHRRFGTEALNTGPVALLPMSALAEADEIIVATGVGAPGLSKAVTGPEDSLQAARALINASGARPRAVMPGHVPGMYAWLIAAGLGLNLLDAAANGRGHPTVKLGGMGMASRSDMTIYQACANRHQGLQVVASGNLVDTSSLMLSAAVQCGGLVMAVRGPLTNAFVTSNGAAEAISFQLALGHAMASAQDRGESRIDAALAALNGRVLISGEIVSSDVVYRDGFDIGQILVRDSKHELLLGVCNEFMTADTAGKRLATFPDLIAALDPTTGDPLAIAELTPGVPTLILFSSHKNIPLGAGVFDAAAYTEIELAMKTDLLRFVRSESVQ